MYFLVQLYYFISWQITKENAKGNIILKEQDKRAEGLNQICQSGWVQQHLFYYFGIMFMF
jgi:hypothetical protein